MHFLEVNFAKVSLNLFECHSIIVRPLLIQGLNFINVLRAAFTHADPKRAKKTVKFFKGFSSKENLFYTRSFRKTFRLFKNQD
jgi:hypothetical protein